MVVLGVYKYGGSFVPKFLRESTLKWVGPSGPPCAQTGVKNCLGTKVLKVPVLFNLNA